MKLIDFLYDWLEHDHKEYVKHQTYIRYRSNIRNYIEGTPIAEKEMTEITRKDMQEFINGMKSLKGAHTGKPLAPGTINNTYVVIQCAFGYAEDYEMIEKNPCTRIRRVPKKVTEQGVKCFTVPEQKKIETFVDTCRNYEYYGFLLDLYTGLRIGELCALTWEDIDFEEGTLTVSKTCYCSQDEDDGGKWQLMTDTPKTRTSFRTIPLPDHILEGLKKKKEAVPGGYVVSMNDGTQMTPWTCRYRYDEMLKKLNIRHINFHGMRHTFATRAIENGMDVRTLSEILGHSNPSITLSVYTHSMNDHKKSMMQMMKRL